jgi:hypothetical protein
LSAASFAFFSFSEPVTNDRRSAASSASIALSLACQRIFLGDRLELVVVAAGALDRQAQE